MIRYFDDARYNYSHRKDQNKRQGFHMSDLKAQVMTALATVIEPELHKDIVTLNMVRDLEIDGSTARFTIVLTTPACPLKNVFLERCNAAVVGKAPGIEALDIRWDSQVPTDHRLQGRLSVPMRSIIAVSSGKGGVGKSTVTLNLAVALSQQGAKVGILDADVYGPSIPLMTGTQTERPMTRDQKILPIHRFGVAMMSLGYLLEDGQAVLWRGPMVAGTVKQLLADVDWGDLDYLLVDLPPGTGDAPMSLAQLAPLSGVVIVTTPHSVAANIAGKAAALFRRLNSPIVGVVENMATFVCPHCNEPARIFSGQTGDELARELGTPFLGSVPLDPSVSQAADQGLPSLVAHPQSIQAAAFRDLAGNLARQISIRAEGAASFAPAVEFDRLPS